MSEILPPSVPVEIPQILMAPVLNRPGFRHGFTTRAGGCSIDPWRSLNLSLNVGDSSLSVAENRRLLARHAGFLLESVVGLSQVHGSSVLRVDRLRGLPPESERLFDASMTDQPGVVLSVRTADCVPLLVMSTSPRAVCAIHAGWRGTLQNITGAAIKSLCDAYGCRPDGLLVAIGPCIHACCYTVDAGVYEQFRSRFGQSVVAGSCEVLRVDLVAANRLQLEAAGVPTTQIEVLDYCTSCREDLFFSHRRDQGVSGRHLAFIGLVS